LIEPGPGGGKRQISTAGGTQPRWQRDGKELFYVALDSHLTVAHLAGKGGVIGVDHVERLFGPLTSAGYDVSADGQRFLALLPPEGETGGPLTVVENWTAALKR
jgi:eukaryotic-like serine/threonine-protein kinase